MGLSVRGALSSWWVEAPASVLVGVARTGVLVAATVGGKIAEAPLHVLENGARVAGDLLDTGPDHALRTDLKALVDPRAERSQRRVVVCEGRATVEVRGLGSAKHPAVVRALKRQLDAVEGVDWWQVNAVTGRIVAALGEGAAGLPELIAAVERVEEFSEVAELDWSRADEYPGDREPLLAAAFQVLGDLAALAASTTGALVPLQAPVRAIRSLTALADTQPRVRKVLEERLGRPRADLVLTLANALGTAVAEEGGSGVPNLLVDTVQRAMTLTEAIARHQRWRGWEADLLHHEYEGVTDPLPEHDRPQPLPGGPIERVADETAGASLAGAAALALGGRLGDTSDALALGAPKAARASREAFATTVSTMLARAGVLTLHPGALRRLDRVDTLLIDGEALLTDRRVVLEAEAGDDPGWHAERVWSAAQQVLWDRPAGHGRRKAGEEPSPRLVHLETGTADRGPTIRPVWRELRDGERTLGRVLVGREIDRRAHGVLTAARAAGLRTVLAAGRDAGELRSLVDEFVSGTVSYSRLVHDQQADGRVVAVLSPRAHKALAWADFGIGLLGADVGTPQVPWGADAVCRELDQVQLVLAAIAPAREASERGRSLALSAATLGGLMLAVSPGRAAHATPMLAAHCAGLLNGAVTGWRAMRTEPRTALAPLLPWHALQPDEALRRLPEPLALDDRPALDSAPEGVLRTRLAPAVAFAGHLRRELDDPLTPILGVGAIATAVLGSPSDAVLLSSVLAVNAVVSARQRQRAERALHHLMEKQQLTGHLVDRAALDERDPDTVEVPAERLTVGDVILVRAGEVVPADARLLRVRDLELDESGLTGESVTVEKRVDPTPGAAPADRSCMVFEGTTVVNGSALAVVVAVGDDTQAGRATAGAVPPDKAGVQAQLRKLTDRALPFTLAGGGLVALLGGVRGNTLRAAISDGVAVAVSAVPEGLPLVATVAQLAAARRLSRYGVLVRASRTVEALGRVDTLCFDKTGTLTEGRLRLTMLADLNEQWEPQNATDGARVLLRAAARACPDPEDGPVLHATDRAVLDAAAEVLGDDAHEWDPIDEIPFESNRGYAAALGHTTKRLRLMVKGAPEVVLPRCAKIRTEDGAVALTAEVRERAERAIHELAERGLRVLVVARRDFSDRPEDVEDAVGELTLLGFVGLADTPRPQTVPLVQALQDNGISVRMITGDHPVTAVAVAEQLGIEVGEVATGADLDELDEGEQNALIERSTVFARVNPEQKVRIVAALRRNGHVVGMTGDGANDAAAIRTADVGIGLAAHGSAAARNAADLVLTDPDPTALLHALVEGRGMWRRVTDAVGVLVGGNAGEVAFTAFGTAVNGRAPLGTRQFLLVNMLTDMFPALALALSPSAEESGPEDGSDADAVVARRAAQLAEIPPADLGDDLLRTLAVRGAVTASGAATAWTIGRVLATEQRAATIGLVALIGTQLGQTLVSGRRSPMVWVTTAASGAVLGAVVMTPGLCHYFGCTPLGPVGWTVATGSAVAATAGAAVLPRLLPTPQPA